MNVAGASRRRGGRPARLSRPAPGRAARVAVQIEAAEWRRALPGAAALCRRAALAALAAAAAEATAEIVLLLGDDARLRALNRQFRGQDKPTNVLSFPAGAAGQGGPALQPLGDIALAFETVAREAAAQGKTLADHAGHLVVHGVLHLLGYDHERAREAAAMERLETRILAGLGIADPYRAAAPARRAGGAR
jgi:probable rRNA maturation factor